MCSFEKINLKNVRQNKGFCGSKHEDKCLKRQIEKKIFFSIYSCCDLAQVKQQKVKREEGNEKLNSEEENGMKRSGGTEEEQDRMSVL